MARTAPSYVGKRPASEVASARARASSRKSGTGPELLLKRAMLELGLRPRTSRRRLPGRPDFVFAQARVVVFVDGDYWHGRDWARRRAKLARGSNADYWIAKIERNMARDLETSARLVEEGWRVLRFWEGDIRRSPSEATAIVVAAVRAVATSLEIRSPTRLRAK